VLIGTQREPVLTLRVEPLGSIDNDSCEEDALCGGATGVATMDSFDHLLTWRLKRGSHRFPGPDVGTCINEAALIAAGHKYKPICFVEQMPSCFSRPVCRLAMRLNDMATDQERQRLLPYVARLTCADTREVERQRAAFTRKQILGYFPCLSTGT
jgi:hypothetical protein